MTMISKLPTVFILYATLQRNRHNSGREMDARKTPRAAYLRRDPLLRRTRPEGGGHHPHRRTAAANQEGLTAQSAVTQMPGRVRDCTLPGPNTGAVAVVLTLVWLTLKLHNLRSPDVYDKVAILRSYGRHKQTAGAPRRQPKLLLKFRE